MSIQQRVFGKTADGTEVGQFTITSKGGLVAKVISYGLRLAELHAPDRNGKSANVVQGFDRLESYLSDGSFQGATIGRYGNRIARGKFTLDGKDYQLPINNAPNSLHGGPEGFDKRIWKVEQAGENAIRGTYVSKDGEEGYPGTLTAHVTISLTDQNELKFEYEATTDAPTVLNLTNHSYFNLTGAGSGTILDHVVTLHADKYTPVDDTQIPTGEIVPVAGTAFDFTTPHSIGERIAQTGTGYDHNFVVNESGRLNDIALNDVAAVRDPKSGRVMEVMSTQPGVQFYTGNFLDGSLKGIGGAYIKHGAFCLETQHFPDSPNHPKFPSTVLRPGETYRQTTVYRFKA